MKLTASDIHVELGGNEILKGIDAAIKEKEFVGIIGPNGSGKSTLLKCIYRVLKPDTGVIMLDGKPLNEYKVKDSAKALAVVSQHNYYNFEFSVQEIVMMGRAPHKKPWNGIMPRIIRSWKSVWKKWECFPIGTVFFPVCLAVSSSESFWQELWRRKLTV